MLIRKIKEFFIERMIFLSGIMSIVIVALIFAFLLKEGLSVFWRVPISDFLFARNWYPISDPPQFGILPLIIGSILVTAGAGIISIPIGIASALFIAEIAPRKTAEHRRSPRVHPFSLQGVEDSFDLIGHWRTELECAN